MRIKGGWGCLSASCPLPGYCILYCGELIKFIGHLYFITLNFINNVTPVTYMSQCRRGSSILDNFTTSPYNTKTLEPSLKGRAITILPQIDSSNCEWSKFSEGVFLENSFFNRLVKVQKCFPYAHFFYEFHNPPHMYKRGVD